MKKYKLTEETKEWADRTLYRIEALKKFGNVEKGEGGWVEKEDNLSQEGNAWVYGNAWVFGDARVYGNAEVFGGARVYGNIKLESGFCFARQNKGWNVTMVWIDDDNFLLIKDYKEPDKTHTITIDGKEIEISEESYQELKASLN